MNKRKLLGGLALGGIASTPFLGMIGEDKVTKDPSFNPNIPVFDKNELISKAQRGDVFAVSKPGWKGAIGKIPQVLTTGSEFYHIEPVIKASPTGRGLGTVSITARVADDSVDSVMGKLHGDRDKGEKEVHTIDPNLLQNPSPYMESGNLLLLRPKTKLTDDALSQYENELKQRATLSYDTPHAISSWLDDIFIPKPLRTVSKEAEDATKNICSNASAVALSNVLERRIHPEVAPLDTLPVDYLREDSEYEPVGATTQGTPLFKNPMAPRLATRAALGALLAGGAYGMYKNPRVFATLAGAAALPAIARAASSDSKSVPNIPDRFLSDLAPENEASKKTRQDFLLKTVPLSVAGGAGAYATARGVQRVLKSMAAGPNPNAGVGTPLGGPSSVDRAKQIIKYVADKAKTHVPAAVKVIT
jgi:hypothetical protein